MRLTLLHAVLLGTILLILLAGDALDALVVVVLGGGTLLRLGAFCGSNSHKNRSALLVAPSCLGATPPGPRGGVLSSGENISGVWSLTCFELFLRVLGLVIVLVLLFFLLFFLLSGLFLGRLLLSSVL